MSKNVAMFVDVANMYYAARGQDVDVDYVALLKHATKGRDLIRAYAYTGLDPENENQRKFIDFLAKNGYKPVIKDIRKFGDGRMKANLDIELVVDLFRLRDRMDIAVVVSGDGDFAPAIKALQDFGVRCEVISFKPNTSSDLIAVADEFLDIMKIASISRKKAEAAVRDRGMSAPEMPAKEVVPEFGFRDASPAVAAAALAALKGGGSSRGNGGARRGRGRSPAPDAPVPETPAVATQEPDADEQHRRRRRRGGRGRGRGRREESAADQPATSDSSEIGWQEFDDIGQLDALEQPREYSFEEADADTLRELGMLDAGPTVPEQARTADTTDEKPKPRRRSTRAKAEPAAPSAPSAPSDAADDDARPKPRRRSTRAKAEAAEPSASATADDDAKPKPRRRSTRAKAEPAAPSGAAATDDKPKPRRRSTRARAGDGEPSNTSPASSDEDQPQGIWGRFRSGRSTRGS